MARKKLKLEELEVESFTASRDGKPAPAGGVHGHSGDYSCALGNTAWCDTDRDCSGVCLVATNVCSPC